MHSQYAMHILAAALVTITPLVGWEAGGSVDVNQVNTSVKPAAAYGVMVSFNRGRGRELDLVAIDQESRAERHDPFTEPASVDVNVLSLQIGGRYVIDPDARTKPYVAATVGVTQIRAGDALTVAPSGALGGGADIQLRPNLALRLDGRVHVTLTNANTTIVCSGGGIGGTCSGSSTGSNFTQFVASAGLAFRF